MDKLALASSHLPVEMLISLIEEFSPESMAIAEVVHPFDISVSKKIYERFPKFGAEADGLAHRFYSAEVHMGNDRELFAEDPDAIPVFEGRMVDLFDHRAKRYISGRGRAGVWQELPFGSPEKAIGPQWRIAQSNIPNKVAARWQEYRIGFCDVASPTNQRALVSALIPPFVICGDKVPTIQFRPADDRLMLLWLGVANSFIVDFLVRKKVALKMSYTVMDSLPLPRIFTGSSIELEIAKRALRLCATGHEMRRFWEETAPLVGLKSLKDTPSEDEAERRVLKAENDVIVARDLFRLTLDEMRYVLDPSDILGNECGFETFGALKREDEREYHGKFFTRDLIVSTWKTLQVFNDVEPRVRSAATADSG